MATQRPTGGSTPNVTAQWLNLHLTPEEGQTSSKLMDHLRAKLSRKCTHSSKLGIIDEHIAHYVANLIHRDALCSRIKDGSISYSYVATYAVRSAYSEMRDFATDALTREVTGARTAKERAEKARREAEQENLIPVRKKTDKVTKTRRDDVSYSEWDVSDQGDSVSDLEDRLHFEKVWSRLEDVMRAAKPKSWQRYCNLLKMQIVDDLPVKKIAEIDGVSAPRAATMLQEARMTVRSAGREGLFGS